MKVPVKGRISQKFGENPDIYARFGYKGHNGVDYAVPNGTPIYSPHDGVVRERRYDADGYGNYLKIENDTEGSVLGHLKSFVVNINKHVKEGDLLGYSNNTGFSTGPHLHWGYYRKPRDRSNGFGGFIDQLPYLSGGDEEGGDDPLNLDEKIPEAVKKEFNLVAYGEFNNNEETWRTFIEKWKEYVTKYNTCKDSREDDKEEFEKKKIALEDEIIRWKEKASKATEFEGKWQRCVDALAKKEDEVNNKQLIISDMRSEASKRALELNTCRSNVELLRTENNKLRGELDVTINNISWMNLVKIILGKLKKLKISR